MNEAGFKNAIKYQYYVMFELIDIFKLYENALHYLTIYLGCINDWANVDCTLI